MHRNMLQPAVMLHNMLLIILCWIVQASLPNSDFNSASLQLKLQSSSKRMSLLGRAGTIGESGVMLPTMPSSGALEQVRNILISSEKYISPEVCTARQENAAAVQLAAQYPRYYHRDQDASQVVCPRALVNVP